MKNIFLSLAALFCFSVSYAQSAKQILKIYGDFPTQHEDMQWVNDGQPSETYEGVIQVDSDVSPREIVEAFMRTFQAIQDANLMTKQMRNNNTIGAIAGAMSGSPGSVESFARAGDADDRNQFQNEASWTVQFIDGVRLNRFYYNVSLKAKQGRFKLVVTPSGMSGYGMDHIQTEWSQIWRDGVVKGSYKTYYPQMKTKMQYTLDQWIQAVEEELSAENDDW